MSDSDKRRAEQAKELLEHPLMVEAFAAIESKYIQAWRASPKADAAGREKLFWLVTVLDDVRGHLKAHLEAGAAAEIRLRDEEKRRRLLGIF